MGTGSQGDRKGRPYKKTRRLDAVRVLVRATLALSLTHIFLGPLLRRIYKDELEIIPENGKNFLRPVIRLSIDDLKRCGEETAWRSPCRPCHPYC